jgi:hypothetical protein
MAAYLAYNYEISKPIYMAVMGLVGDKVYLLVGRELKWFIR